MAQVAELKEVSRRQKREIVRRIEAKSVLEKGRAAGHRGYCRGRCWTVSYWNHEIQRDPAREKGAAPDAAPGRYGLMFGCRYAYP